MHSSRKISHILIYKLYLNRFSLRSWLRDGNIEVVHSMFKDYTFTKDLEKGFCFIF